MGTQEYLIYRLNYRETRVCDPEVQVKTTLKRIALSTMLSERDFANVYPTSIICILSPLEGRCAIFQSSLR